MKKYKKHNNQGDHSTVEADKISRGEAIVKVGKYAAFTAASMMIVLSPKESQAGSPTPLPPGW
jgi:hypothetical protein